MIDGMTPVLHLIRYVFMSDILRRLQIMSILGIFGIKIQKQAALFSEPGPIP
jgi:hypothetical protein